MVIDGWINVWRRGNNKLKYICWDVLIQRAFADSDIDAAGFILKVMERWHLFICRLCLICLAYILWHVRATPWKSRDKPGTVRHIASTAHRAGGVKRHHNSSAKGAVSRLPQTAQLCPLVDTYVSPVDAVDYQLFFSFFFSFFSPLCVQLKPGLVLSPYQSSPRSRPAL